MASVVEYVNEVPYLGDRRRRLFKADDTKRTANFEVIDKPVILRLFDLCEDDCVCINQRLVNCCNDEIVIAPLLIDGCRQCMDCNNTTLIVPIPGNYELERSSDCEGTIVTIEEASSASIDLSEAVTQWL